MSLFRRKHEGDDARDERAAARPDRAAERREPEPESIRPGARPSPRAIAAPAADEIVSGLVEVRIAPDETATGPVLLEWRPAGETGWQRADAEEREGLEGGPLLWDTGSLDDGSYLLRPVALHSGGDEVAGEPVPVSVDNLGPEIRLGEPLEGRTLAGFVTIGVEAEDSVSGVSVVELEISESGESWRRVAETCRQPFELRWSSEALADGVYRLRIGARDGSGNLSLIGPLEVEIANSPVAAELVDPGELLRGRVNLIARTPDLRSSQMIFQLAKAGSSDWRALGTTRAPFHLPVDTALFADGSYELRIESVTTEGRSVYSRRFGPYVVDNRPPVIRIVKPAQGETLQDRAEVAVEVVDDASGPALVELSYNDGDKWMSLAGLEPEEGKVRGFWQLTECRPGDCRLRVTAFDRAGNEASEEITVTISAPAPSEPRRAPEPEPVPPARPRAAMPVRPPSAAAAGRFGDVPSWDWKRHRSSGAERTGGAANGPIEEAKAPQTSGEPAPPAGATAEPPDLAAPREQAKKSAAWTWKPSPPRPEPEEEPAIPHGAEKERPAETESEAAGKPKPESELEEQAEPEPELEPEVEPEPESETEERAEPVEEAAAVQAVRLVDSVPSEEQEETERENENESPESGAGEGGSVVSVNFARAARGWDIWELSELVEETAGQDPAREEERRQILYHLREHTTVDGRIPPEFEDLIHEAFGELLPGDRGA